MEMNGVADLENAGLMNASDIRHPMSSSFLGSMSNSSVMDEAFKTVSDLCQDNKLLKETVQENNVFMKKQCEIIKNLREEREKEKQEIREKADQAKKVITTLSNTVDLKNKMIEDLSAKLREYQERPRRLSNYDSLRSDRSDQGNSSTERSLGTDSIMENLRQQLEDYKDKVHKLESEKNDLLALNSDLNLQLHTSKKRNAGEGEASNGFVLLPTPVNETAPERVSMEKAAAQVQGCAGDTGQQDSISDLLKQLREEQANATKYKALLTHRENEVKEMDRQLKQMKDDLQTANMNSEKQETILKGNIISLVAELKDSESKQLTAEKQLQTLNDRCANNDIQLTRYRDQASKYENQLKRSDYDLASLREENRRLTENQQTWRSEFDKACAEIGRLRDELDKKETARKACSLGHQTAMEDLNSRCMKMQRSLAETAEENRRLDANTKELQNTVELLQCQAEVYKDDFEDERRSKEKLHEDRERLVEEKKAIAKDRLKIEEQMRTLQNKNAQLSDEVRVLTSDNEMLQEKLAARNQECIMTLQRRHGTFKNAGPPGGAYGGPPGGAHVWYSDQAARDPNCAAGNALPGGIEEQQNGRFNAHQEEAQNPPEDEPPIDFICPVCQLHLPDMDSLHLHCDECIT